MGDSSTPPEKDRPRLERRAIVRLECNKAIVYTAEDSVTYFQGRILDLSATGIAMRVHRKLEEGNTVAVILRRAGLYQAEHFAKVVHVRRDRESGSWIVGCEFGAPLTPEELDNFLVQEEEQTDAIPARTSKEGHTCS